MSDPDPAAGVYTISVAAELAGVTIRSLRLYERRGLLAPARTTGGTRRFSSDDLRRLRRIAELVDDGVNLTGIGKILDLEQNTRELRGDNTALRADITRLRAEGEHPAHPERSAQDKELARRRSSSRQRPPTGIATNHPDRADHHPADRTAHHERPHDHAHTELDQ